MTITRDEPSGAYPGRIYAWTVVAVLIATAIVSYTDRQVLSLLVDPIRKDLGVSDTQISLLMGAAFAVVYGVAGLPLGWLADRASRRNLILAGVAVWSLATISCGLSRGFSEIFASRLFVGLGEAVLSPAAISLISDYFPPRRRGFAVGLFLSGIAMGQGVAILIGGGVLHAVDLGLLAHTALARLAPWRLVLLLIGLPGLVWTLAILAIREPARRADEAAPTLAGQAGAAAGLGLWIRTAPLYLVVASASLVDNAVGAWAPSVLIRGFHQDAGRVGIELGALLTIGFGAGVIGGGWLADWTGARGGVPAKMRTVMIIGLLILPAALLMSASRIGLVIACTPLYFALSGMVTAIGFSSILDSVPNRQRGLAMSVSFFLNVAVGAGIGPTAVTQVSARVFGAAAGLAPALSATMIGGYAIEIAAAILALAVLRASRRAAA